MRCSLFKKLLLTSSITLLSATSIVSYAEYNRMIRNETSQNWIIVNQPYRYSGVLFDSAPKRGPAVCTEASILVNGPCILPPGQVTYVKYYIGYGKLVLTDSFKSIEVRYKAKRAGGGLWMKSTNESIANDNHGDLTIFNR